MSSGNFFEKEWSTRAVTHYLRWPHYLTICLKPKQKWLIFADNFIQSTKWHAEPLWLLRAEKENSWSLWLILSYKTTQNREQNVERA